MKKGKNKNRNPDENKIKQNKNETERDGAARPEQLIIAERQPIDRTTVHSDTDS